MSSKRPLLEERAHLLWQRLHELEDVAIRPATSDYERSRKREALSRAAIRYASVARRYLGGSTGGHDGN